MRHRVLPCRSRVGQCLMTSGVDDKLLYKAGTPKMCEVSGYTVDTSIPASGCAGSLATLNPKPMFVQLHLVICTLGGSGFQGDPFRV